MQSDVDLSRDIATLCDHLDSASTIYRTLRRQLRQRGISKLEPNSESASFIRKVDDAFGVWEDELEKLARDVRLFFAGEGWIPKSPV